MLKNIALIIVVLIFAVLVFAATQPDTFRVERSINIKASPEKIFPLMNDLHNWTAWSPYEKKDPDMKRQHSGATSGKGAIYEWDGDKQVGKGRMEIIESSSPARVVIKLDFLSPFTAHNTAEFILQAQSDSTHVMWVMYGPSNFFSKLMGIFFSMDRMVGDDFATGLANLKAIAEK